MTTRAIGARQPDGSVIHTQEAIKYAFDKAINLLESAGLADSAKIMNDCRPEREPRTAAGSLD